MNFITGFVLRTLPKLCVFSHLLMVWWMICAPQIAETLSQNRAALVEAVNAQLQEGVRYFQSIGFSQFSLPMDALAQLSNLPSVASIKDMTKDQILQVCPRVKY